MKNKLRCVIIDDEKHAINLLTGYIATMPVLELVKAFTNPVEALSNIFVDDKIDIIFLDVEMPHMDGIELATQLKSKSKAIVFTSAYQQYTIDAFDLRATQFLLKPIKLSKFTKVLMEIVDLDFASKEKSGKNIIFIKTGEKGKLTRIYKQDILYFEGAKNYVNMVTTQCEQLVYLTLKEVEELLFSDLFYRVHRSHVINVRKIQKIVGNTINLGNGYQVQMGNFYKESLTKFLEEKTLMSGRT